MEQIGQTEVCAPRSLQIVRGAPSLPQILSYIGFRFPLLPSSAPSFKPLPAAELPLHQFSTKKISSLNDLDDGGGQDRPLEKITVVLDLDETLVCAYETSSLPAVFRTQATEAGLNWFELECVSSDKEVEGKPKISYVTVFERPGLHEFLSQAAEFAELILFTAGLEGMALTYHYLCNVSLVILLSYAVSCGRTGYAKPLVDRIDTEGRFSHRLYRPSTVSTEYREHVKDLSCIQRDLSRVVIIDNNPFSFLLQPMNGIPCIPFSPAQPADNQV
uniref:Mitochondrial import inner membrane translocase subunit TIM50 n=1 Tax=Cucumis melo TaxID=3656 RepID=A0A9I9CVT1_CUCME